MGTAEEVRVDGELVVRRAGAVDLQAALDLLDHLEDLQSPWRVFALRPGARGEASDRYRRALVEENAHHVVAIAGERVVGTAFGEILSPSQRSDERALEISNVVVRPDARGQGIGSALVRELAAFGSRRGVRWAVVKAFADNDEAMGFWLGLGFQPRAVQLNIGMDRLIEAAGNPRGEPSAPT